MEKLWQLSANDLASGIREKNFSAREVVSSVLERIAAKTQNSTPSLLSSLKKLYRQPMLQMRPSLLAKP